jgi:predicted metal-dependent hydrolase
MSETVEIRGLSFEVRRSDRRKTLALTVDRAAELILHAPTETPVEHLARWTESRLLWVHRKLAIKRELEAKVRSPEYVTGESFSYLGKRYRLKLVLNQRVALRFDGGFTLRWDARASAMAHFRRWYSNAGHEWVQQRIRAVAPRVGAMPARLQVRDLGYRWGSCTAKGVVHINWKLLQLPVRLADYVIAHELAHLVERHHGAAFWALLGRAIPDWEERQGELKRKAAEIYWCHAGMTD